MTRPRVGFLFLGELHLIPHLLPIAVALARRPDAPTITLFVATSRHEAILRDALERLALPAVRIERVHGFRDIPADETGEPQLPSKPMMLIRNGFRFIAEDVVVVAERTSLWIPRFTRRLGAPFVYNEHGAGPHANFASPRNRFATRLLMPSADMAERARSLGGLKAQVDVVGYVKPDFMRLLPTAGAMPRFPDARPTVVYVPHWKRDKSSWWGMGEAVLERFARDDRYNLIVAAHVRLPKFDPEFERRVAPYRACPNILIDATSFRLIDQTYIDGADLYLGDGSSQVLEFARRPRPAVFLNPDRHDWACDARFSHWRLGDVVEDVDAMLPALDAAPARHAHYAAEQHCYVGNMMGIDDGLASERAADSVLEVAAARSARRRQPVEQRQIGLGLARSGETAGAGD